jgi:hypothetical protein
LRCLSFLWFTASDCPLVSFGHCVVCPSFDLRLLIANGQKITKNNQKP